MTTARAEVDHGETEMQSKLETLSTALNAYQAAVRSSDPHAAPRAESRLMDACMACGASFDEPSFEEWAAVRVASWLQEG